LKRLHYGWVMVFSAVGILATHALTFYSFGVFLRPVTEEFGWERGALSAAVSVGMVVSAPLSILAGRLSDRYGPRLLVTASGILTGVAFLLMSQISALWHVYLIYGLAVAVGGGGCVVPVTTTIPRWFERRRGVALGLTFTGIGVGGVITPLLSQWLITDNGWRTAYVVMGLINLVVATALAQTLRRSPQDMGLRPYGQTDDQPTAEGPVAMPGLSLGQAVRTARFWTFGVVMFCFVFVLQVMMAHIAPHAVDVGVPATPAASIVSVFAATSLLGRNLAGLVSDRMGPTLSLVFHLTAMALALLWLLFAGDAPAFYAFAIAFGVAYGGVVPLQTLLTGELFGLRFLGTIMASLMVFANLGGAAGPPIAGTIFDVTGSYQTAFVICLTVMVLAMILGGFLLRNRRAQPVIGGGPGDTVTR